MSVLTKMIGRLPRSWIKAASRARWRSRLWAWGFDLVANQLRGRDGTVQQGVGKGLRFNAGRSNAGYLLGTSDPDLQAALAVCLSEGMTFHDVGANVGFFSMIAARLVGPAGTVVSFEPLAQSANQVRYNAALNHFAHVSVLAVALGDTDREARLLVSAQSAWCRLEGLGSQPSDLVGETTVPLKRLDSLLAEGALKAPDVMKVDVEGAEVMVLAGARETLRKWRPVLLIDLHGTNAAVAGLLRELDYRCRVIGSDTPVERAPWWVTVAAVPAERPDAEELVSRLCAGA